MVTRNVRITLGGCNKEVDVPVRGTAKYLRKKKDNLEEKVERLIDCIFGEEGRPQLRN